MTFSGATVNAAHGDNIVVSLSSNQSATGLAFSVAPAGVALGWGAPGMGGTIQGGPASACLGVGAPYASLGLTSSWSTRLRW